jgi:hypothetical protein
MMKRKREEKDSMDIVWQTPANPPLPQDYIFRNGNIKFLRVFTDSSNNFAIQILSLITILTFFFLLLLIEFLQEFDTLDLTTSNLLLMLVHFVNFSNFLI